MTILRQRSGERRRHQRLRASAERKVGAWVRRRQLTVESLEQRTVLSAISALDLSQLYAQPALSSLAAVTNPTPRGYTPSQIAQAYGFSGITFSNGTIKGDGSGQTIAIVDAYNDPNIVNDLHMFDQTFGIANPPKFTVVNQNGGSTLPAIDAGWSEEIALDVEWAHAMAPAPTSCWSKPNPAQSPICSRPSTTLAMPRACRWCP